MPTCGLVAPNLFQQAGPRTLIGTELFRFYVAGRIGRVIKWGKPSKFDVLLVGCVIVFVSAAVAVGTLADSPLVWAALFAALVAIPVLFDKGGWGKIAGTLTFFAFFAAPLISLRLNDSVTYGDVLLLLALLMHILGGRYQSAVSKAWKRILWVGGLMFAGGVLNMLINPASGMESTINMVQYVGTIAIALALVAVNKPGFRAIRAYAFAFGSGVVLSSLVAITDDVNARPPGLSLHSNHLSIAAALAVGAWLALYITATKRLARLAYLAAAATCLMGAVTSGSRAGIVAIVAVFALTVWGSRSGKFATLIFLGAGAAIFGVLSGRIDISDPNNGLGRLLGGGTADEADRGRDEKYRAVWERISDHPLVGNGFEQVRDGHSLYLQMWDAVGILGILAALVLVTAATFGYLKARKERRVLSVALWSGYIGYLVAAILSNQMWDRYLWLALALALMSDYVITPQPAPKPENARPKVGAVHPHLHRQISLQRSGHAAPQAQPTS